MFYDILKKECERQHLKMTPLIVECGGANSSAANWKKGASPNSDIVLKLARRLNVSTDYLLGNTPEQINNNNVNGNSGIIGVVGHTNAPVTIKNDNERMLTTQEQDLLRVYNSSNGKQQMKIMNLIYQIDDELSSDKK